MKHGENISKCFRQRGNRDSNFSNSECAIGMISFNNQKFDNRIIDVDSIMEAEQNQEEDPFLGFIDYARSVLLSEEEGCDSNGQKEESTGPGWSWIASRILRTCIAYSSGVTSAILLSELSQVLSYLVAEKT